MVAVRPILLLLVFIGYNLDLILNLILMAASADNRVETPPSTLDSESSAASTNKANVLQDWDDDGENPVVASSKDQDQDYLASIRDALGEINRETLNTQEEDAIEAMLKELLLSNGNSGAPEDSLYDNMLSKLLGRELLYGPLLDLHNAVRLLFLFW